MVFESFTDRLIRAEQVDHEQAMRIKGVNRFGKNVS